MKRLPAGLMRHSLELHDVAGTTLDDYGQASQTGALIGTFRGRITPLRGRMLADALVNAPTATHKVELPWLGPAIPATTDNPHRKILPTMYFILEDGSRLDIVFAGDVNKDDLMWELTCTERVKT